MRLAASQVIERLRPRCSGSWPPTTSRTTPTGIRRSPPSPRPRRGRWAAAGHRYLCPPVDAVDAALMKGPSQDDSDGHKLLCSNSALVDEASKHAKRTFRNRDPHDRRLGLTGGRPIPTAAVVVRSAGSSAVHCAGRLASPACPRSHVRQAPSVDVGGHTANELAAATSN